MQQHPVPQNVTAYEFHLIGNMTLKQFMELGGGIGVAVFIYATNLPEPIKWTLIVLSALGGVALAFLPFDGRPLDRMIMVFFKSVYSPTQYIWKKTADLPEYFKFKPRTKKALSMVDLEKQKVRKNLGEYLDTLPQKPVTNPIDNQEDQYLFAIQQLFQTVPAAVNVAPSTTTISVPQPKPSMKIHKLTPRLVEEKGPVIEEQARIIEEVGQDIKPIKNEVQKKYVSMPQQEEIAIPGGHIISVETSIPAVDEKVTTAITEVAETGIAPNLPTPTQNLPKMVGNMIGQAATLNQNLPFPAPPQTPNTLVGMVLTSDGRIVENAIIEVRNQDGVPVRAIKTNKLGQFFSATQLNNGNYQIEVEKEGLEFGVVNLSLTGQKVSPLEIRAKALI